jgi:Fe-S cluster assembly protein SufD
MIDVMKEKDLYLSAFAQLDKQTADEPAFLRRLRETAIERFAELGFPTARNEDWRFTSVARLAQTPFRPGLPEDGEGRDLLSEFRQSVGDPDALGHGLVFLNGHLLDQPGGTRLPGGVTVRPLREQLDLHPEEVEPHLARYAGYESHAFTALNTAFLRDGAFVHVPNGTLLDRPLYLVHLSANRGEPTVSHPRNLVVVGRNSQVTLVEAYVGRDGEVYFTNAVTELVVGENAFVDHYKLQREGRDAFHVANTQIHQARSSNFTSLYVSLGGGLVRNEVRSLLGAEGCEATINGLYLATDRQHVDNLTVIDHAKPHCASHELYKGILDGRAHGVFNGKIFVRQDAQKTDAKQTNQTLLLSEDAVINTKPQLEIFADDVKCTHGATVGQLAADALFYLRSRGLGLEEARDLLTYAFANDVIEKIKVEPLRRRLEELLLARQHLPAPSDVEEI